MNPQGPDELISAYFDGEVSPDERSEVERLLTGNDDAQRELNETARLSALLHSFPREAAPVELAANVLRQTNQIPLAAQPSKVATANTTTRTVWRDWKAGFAGAAMTAVAMCLVVVLNSSQTNEHAQTVATGLHVEMPSAPAPPTAGAKPGDGLVAMDDRATISQEAAQPFGAALDSTKDVAAKQASTVPAPMVMSRGRGLLERKASGPSAMAEMASDASVAPRPAIPPSLSDTPALGLNGPGLSNDDFVKGLREGKVYVVVPQPADPNSNVAVVYFEVVDIDRSAEQMQVLLKKNSIEPRSSNKDSQPMGDDFVVIYTVADGDKLAKTLKDVDQHRDLFLNWTAQAPLQLAAVAEQAAQQPQKKDLAGGGASGDKEKQSEKPAGPAEPNGDMPEVQIVLDAYAQRNGFANPALSNSITNPNGQYGSNREMAENLKRQQIANSAVEKSKSDSNLRSGSPTANQGQLTQLARTEAGYDYVRLNNSMVVNNGTAPGQANTTQVNPIRMEQASRQLAFRNTTKMANNDANNRALRMLFVLHPQSDGAQIPAAAAPAKP